MYYEADQLEIVPPRPIRMWFYYVPVYNKNSKLHVINKHYCRNEAEAYEFTLKTWSADCWKIGKPIK